MRKEIFELLDKVLRVIGAPNIGQLTSDGVYIGRFKDEKGVKKDYFANTEDDPYIMSFRQASDDARRLQALGHNDWEVPSPKILSAMFNNRAKFRNRTDGVKAFNEPNSPWSGIYWSSKADSFYETKAIGLRFGGYIIDGHRIYEAGERDSVSKKDALSVRFVRGIVV